MALSTDAKARLVIALTSSTVGAEVSTAIDAGDGSQPILLASTTNGEGASLVGVEDSGGLLTATNVETSLAELALAKSKLALTTTGNGASLIGVEDAGSFLTAANVEAALVEVLKYIPLTLADPGTGVAIPVTRSASIAITTAAAETNTLAIPTFVGQKLVLSMSVRAVGDRVVTSAQRINTAGNTTITFDTAGDAIVLQAITIAGVLRWQVVVNDGCTLG